MTARRREVALLGGSFNPPHVAHLMAAYWTLATQGVDEAWLLPTWKHAFGKPLAPFEDRVRMCELAAAAVRGLHVCTAEAELRDDPLVGKTARTLEHLVAKHPALRFALVVGTDILPEVTKWYRWDRVQELARVVVVGRQGHPEGAEGRPLLPPVSSTEIRARLARGDDVSALLPRRVREYVEERGLYR
ncbi:nicotinate (nicotinamide) nucleotide adenylyltransferase [Anaeromyxobacter diazotrophicus]|uniref:Probable nicotinate-nucleotide adenylyltransferase n=1 Tax=Anaeromyxobacter diazotrophicus TaxID=2590199 RepID=A0A7I9VJV1_9BACT|nr:nicotinate (nicotinamide) nucleotide adenylyltransferase [Anaeromyxobacter diazotrophicus]GEJ56430.1 putative nicotinate-nucleotide adenylyltransferase [Anaeromyxobacter diazotrophicus]